MTRIPGNSFKETDIRPDRLMDRARELLEEDTRRLMADKATFVRVRCPACASNRSEWVLEKRGMDFEICQDCATVYGNPRPSPERLKQYYVEAKYYDYWNQYIYPQSEAARRINIFRPRAERILQICNRFGISTRTLVEVGAGSGLFCEEMREFGVFKQIVAVEPTPASAESCRGRGFRVVQDPIENVRLEEDDVDVVAAFEVIEHLFEPSRFITEAARLLPRGGLLVITCPNIKGFDLLVLRELSDTITPEHLNYFHPASLTYLFHDCGFDVLEAATPGKLDAEIVRKKALAGQFDLSGIGFLQEILVERWDEVGERFQEFLAANRLSSHMWITGRKK
ncbi:MAG: class I SAM-dependent methyltransferase [bacterium]